MNIFNKCWEEQRCAAGQDIRRGGGECSLHHQVNGVLSRKIKNNWEELHLLSYI